MVVPTKIINPRKLLIAKKKKPKCPPGCNPEQYSMQGCGKSIEIKSKETQDSNFPGRSFR